jgi:hypothetical protein
VRSYQKPTSQSLELEAELEAELELELEQVDRRETALCSQKLPNSPHCDIRILKTSPQKPHFDTHHQAEVHSK